MPRYLPPTQGQAHQIEKEEENIPRHTVQTIFDDLAITNV